MTDQYRTGDGRGGYAVPRTPGRRLLARGFEFDERGRTIAKGYGPQHAEYEADPWEWTEKRKPDLVLRCAEAVEAAGATVARAWRVPGGEIRMQTATHAQELDGTQYGGPDNVLLDCPRHGRVLVPAQWVRELIASTNRQGRVQCTDPRPVYDRP